MNATKRCTACNADKPLSEFWEQRRDKTHQSRCKACSRTGVKMWLASNPDAQRKHKRDAYARDPAVPITAQIQRRAKDQGIPTNLTVDYVRDMLSSTKVCPALGIPLKHKLNGHQDGPRFDSPSIDRFRAEEGYVKGNVYVISLQANRIKSNATADQLRKVAAWMDTVTQANEV